MRLYGIAEIAQETGIKPGTIAQWHRRGLLPEPSARLAMGPVWTSVRLSSWLDGLRKPK